MAKGNIFIATPMYGGHCEGPYMLSMLGFVNACHQQGYNYTVGVVGNEALITRARNQLVHDFLRTNCSHLVFIDSDIMFDGYDVISMIEADVDIVGGAYPKKEINWTCVHEAAKTGVDTDELKFAAGNMVLTMFGDTPTRLGQPAEVRHVGTGFMAVKRHVFEALADKVPAYIPGPDYTGEPYREYFAISIDPETRIMLSEDYHFCDLWRKHGGKIYCAYWTQLSHVGTHVFTGRLRQRKE